MSYYDEFSFAAGYYHIDPRGIVTFSENTPQEIKDRFWEVWKEMRPFIIEREKKGLISSRYPFLPIEDEDPNKDQYS